MSRYSCARSRYCSALRNTPAPRRSAIRQTQSAAVCSAKGAKVRERIKNLPAMNHPERTANCTFEIAAKLGVGVEVRLKTHFLDGLRKPRAEAYAFWATDSA
jgi:hypothetical protein